MHQKYTTEGFLVSSRPSGEGDRLVSLYTSEFGLVLAVVPGVRNLKSKLRPHLQSGALLSITLLRARARWKVVEVKTNGKLPFPSDDYRLFERIVATLRSLVHGEEKSEKLWNVVLRLFKALHREGAKDYKSLECVTMISVLSALGYGKIEEDPRFKDVFEKKSSLSPDEQKKIIKEINHALEISGLDR